MTNGASEVITLLKTYTLGGTVLSNTFVKLDSNGEVVNTVDGEKAKGVAMEGGVAGDKIAVALQNAGNIVQVRSGAAVTQGNNVASDLNGKAINAATADFEIGQADEGSSALDEFAIVHLTTGGVAP